jgi:glycosyltransferase involved in cell wall biosynthesis
VGSQVSREAGRADSARIVVTVCIRYYLPGFKSGGPVRSIANVVEQLGDEFDFRIVTSDRDIHDTRPYPAIVPDAWQPVGKARVFYASPASQTLRGMAAVLNSVDSDLIYLNSFFDGRFTVLPLLARRLAMLRQGRAIVAPRGEFSAGALRIRAWKKLPFRLASRLMGLYAGVRWHASTELERTDIGRSMGRRAADRTLIAINVPSAPSANGPQPWRPRQPNEPLRVAFMSRIAPKKNLDFALRVVGSSPRPLVFNVFGMVDDAAYWQSCQAMMGSLPPHVHVEYRGAVPHEDVAQTLAAHDVLFLPTLGENFGHVIAESLMQGTPVLISDRTPWRGLPEAGVGWDLPLEHSAERFLAALQSLAEMPPPAAIEMRSRVVRYATERLGGSDAREANRRLLQHVAGS